MVFLWFSCVGFPIDSPSHGAPKLCPSPLVASRRDPLAFKGSPRLKWREKAGRAMGHWASWETYGNYDGTMMNDVQMAGAFSSIWGKKNRSGTLRPCVSSWSKTGFGPSLSSPGAALDFATFLAGFQKGRKPQDAAETRDPLAALEITACRHEGYGYSQRTQNSNQLTCFWRGKESSAKGIQGSSSLHVISASSWYPQFMAQLGHLGKRLVGRSCWT